jgi:hypothetical protein
VLVPAVAVAKTRDQVAWRCVLRENDIDVVRALSEDLWPTTSFPAIGTSRS